MVKIQIEIEKYTLDRLSRHINDLIIPDKIVNKDDYVINYLLDELESYQREIGPNPYSKENQIKKQI